MTDYASLLLPDETPLTNPPPPAPPQGWTWYSKLPPLPQPLLYGFTLERNKARLSIAFDRVQLKIERRVLLMAMAMQETNTLSEGERDMGKDDHSDGSRNYSIFNLSEDMIRQVDPSRALAPLNLNANLTDVVRVIGGALDKWGVSTTLDFVRGGRDAFNDHISWGAPKYRRVIATILKQITVSPQLLSDNRRPMIDLEHV